MSHSRVALAAASCPKHRRRKRRNDARIASEDGTPCRLPPADCLPTGVIVTLEWRPESVNEKASYPLESRRRIVKKQLRALPIGSLIGHYSSACSCLFVLDLRSEPYLRYGCQKPFPPRKRSCRPLRRRTFLCRRSDFGIEAGSLPGLQTGMRADLHVPWDSPQTRMDGL